MKGTFDRIGQYESVLLVNSKTKKSWGIAARGNDAWSMVNINFEIGWRRKTSRSNIHWIGLKENLQETIVFTIKYRGFL